MTCYQHLCANTNEKEFFGVPAEMRIQALIHILGKSVTFTFITHKFHCYSSSFFSFGVYSFWVSECKCVKDLCNFSYVWLASCNGYDKYLGTITTIGNNHPGAKIAAWTNNHALKRKSDHLFVLNLVINIIKLLCIYIYINIICFQFSY